MNGNRDRGTSTVLAMTLVCVFMAGALIWLSRTVDRQLQDRPHAAAIAYGAARAGAQQVDVGQSTSVVVVDITRATYAAQASVHAALEANGDSGSVDHVDVVGSRVTVTVTITSSGRPITATGTATARAGFSDG